VNQVSEIKPKEKVQKADDVLTAREPWDAGEQVRANGERGGKQPSIVQERNDSLSIFQLVRLEMAGKRSNRLE